MVKWGEELMIISFMITYTSWNFPNTYWWNDHKLNLLWDPWEWLNAYLHLIDIKPCTKQNWARSRTTHHSHNSRPKRNKNRHTTINSTHLECSFSFKITSAPSTNYTQTYSIARRGWIATGVQKYCWSIRDQDSRTVPASAKVMHVLLSRSIFKQWTI